MTTNLLVSAGACYTKDGSFDKCALQPSDCPSVEFFRSSYWLSQNSKVSVSTQCSNQQSIRNLNSLGRCNGQADRYICTSDKTACRFAAVFEPNTNDCNLVHDFYTDNEFSNAHYGFCEDKTGEQDHFCTWSFQGCGGSGSNYEWHGADTFFADSKPFCHCDDVRIGACVDNSNKSELFCAVSSDVCDTVSGFSFLSVLKLESQLSTVCNLCDTLTEADLNTPVGGPTKSEKNNTWDGGKIAGITIGVTFGVLSIFIISVIVIRRKRRSKPSTSKTAADVDLNSVL